MTDNDFTVIDLSSLLPSSALTCNVLSRDDTRTITFQISHESICHRLSRGLRFQRERSAAVSNRSGYVHGCVHVYIFTVSHGDTRNNGFPVSSGGSRENSRKTTLDATKISENGAARRSRDLLFPVPFFLSISSHFFSFSLFFFPSVLS